MEIFKSIQFDRDEVGDAACKELFSKSPSKAQAKKKISKKKLKGIKHIEKTQGEKITIEKTKKGKPKTKISENILIKKHLINRSDETYPKKKRKRKRESINLDKLVETSKPQIKKFKPKRGHKSTEISRSEDLSVISVSTKNKRNNFKNNTNSNSEMQEIKIHNVDKLDYSNKKKEKLKVKLKETLFSNGNCLKKNKKPVTSLRQRMMEKLKSARFRYLNEQIYSSDSKEAQKLFKSDPDAFKAYHEGYRQQVNKWPLNPLDVIIKSIQKLPQTHVIADFGCGDAQLAKSVKQQVHSFDLVANNELVTAADMAHVPLDNNSVDVVVFCLSLMGTNLQDYILEANRVLKAGGLLKIAEVESRFDDINQFIEGVSQFRFKCIWKDLSHNLFYFLDFKKELDIKNKKKLPTISLHPCLYKKR